MQQPIDYDIIYVVRDLIRFFLVGAIILITSYSVNAKEYKVLVLPDNIVTDTKAIDSFIYDQTAEFFADGVINILNNTDMIEIPTVSDERQLLKGNPSYMIPARNLMNKFKTTYNIDYPQLKKLAKANNTKYALLLTSTIDAENYVMRRTLWDFLNIAGASVIDPAYKISTYAVVVDTEKNTALWSDTYYKTISVVEGRILTRGPSPQTEQLQKIRDYSQMLCPEIAEKVQLSVLSPEDYDSESKKVYYDMGNFDNIFTKKYRRWGKEGKKDCKATINNAKNGLNSTKTTIKEKTKRNSGCSKCTVWEQQMDVKAEEYKPEQTEVNVIETNIQNINMKKQTLDDQSLYEPIDIKRTRKNNLYGDYDPQRPPLRDYYK